MGSSFVKAIIVSQKVMITMKLSGFNCIGRADRSYNCTPCLQGYFGGNFGNCKPCPLGEFCNHFLVLVTTQCTPYLVDVIYLIPIIVTTVNSGIGNKPLVCFYLNTLNNIWCTDSILACMRTQQFELPRLNVAVT